MVLLQLPTQKCQLGMSFILTKKPVIVQVPSEQSSNKGILCPRCLHYGWVLRAVEHRSPVLGGTVGVNLHRGLPCLLLIIFQ